MGSPYVRCTPSSRLGSSVVPFPPLSLSPLPFPLTPQPPPSPLLFIFLFPGIAPPPPLFPLPSSSCFYSSLSSSMCHELEAPTIFFFFCSSCPRLPRADLCSCAFSGAKGAGGCRPRATLHCVVGRCAMAWADGVWEGGAVGALARRHGSPPTPSTAGRGPRHGSRWGAAGRPPTPPSHPSTRDAPARGPRRHRPPPPPPPSPPTTCRGRRRGSSRTTISAACPASTRPRLGLAGGPPPVQDAPPRCPLPPAVQDSSISPHRALSPSPLRNTRG